MPSTYTSSLRLTLPATGENAGTWGNLVNTGITTLIDTSIAGTASITIAGTDYTLSNNNGTTDEARAMFINATGTPGAARNVICPAVSKMYVFRNNTTGGFAMTLKTSAGTGIAVPAGQNRVLYCDGTNVVEAVNAFGSLTLGTALPLTSGGTGQTTAQASMNSFAGAVTSGQYLRGNGTNVVMSAIQAADVPTLNQNTTGTAANVTGTVAVANGGTGATTLTANNFLLGNGTSAVTASSLLQVASNYVRPVAYADTVVAAGNTGTALTLTCTNGNVFTATLTGNATITLSTPIGSGSATSITLILTNDATAGRTVAWAGGSFIFPGGAASLTRTTAANATDVWVFFTTNGGTTWYGNIAMKDMKA